MSRHIPLLRGQCNLDGASLCLDIATHWSWLRLPYCGGGTASPTSSSPGSNGTSVPGTLVVSSSAIAFGNVALGSSTAQTGKLTAATSAVTVSSASWNGDGFSVSGITFPVTLTPGQSASFTVTFAPQAAGSASGGISFLSNASN